MNEWCCQAYPQTIDFVLTKECNLDCIMCPRIREEKTTLPLAGVERLWHLLPGIKRISWQGGEVFLVPYFVNLLRRICAEYPSIEHGIITNGQILTEEFMELYSWGNIRLQFSIDSITKSNYESIRRGGNFDRLLGNLASLRRHTDKKFAVHVVIMRRNMSELRDFPEFCRENNVNHLDFTCLNSGNRTSVEDVFRDVLLVKELALIVENVEKRSLDYGISFNCNFKAMMDSFLSQGGAPQYLQFQPKRFLPFQCNRPWVNLFVYADGGVRPACECTKNIGNVLHDSFDALWNGETMQIYRRKIINSDAAGWCSHECANGIVNPEYRK